MRAAFIVATLAGSMAVALTVWLVGLALRTSTFGRNLAIVAVISALGLIAVQLVTGHTVQSSWQVPQEWRYKVDIEILAAAYGFLLGTGVLTAVVLSAFWVFVAITLMVSLPIAVAGWSLYAAVRSAGFLAMSIRGSAERRLTRHYIRLLSVGAAILSVILTTSALSQNHL